MNIRVFTFEAPSHITYLFVQILGQNYQVSVFQSFRTIFSLEIFSEFSDETKGSKNPPSGGHLYLRMRTKKGMSCILCDGKFG